MSDTDKMRLDQLMVEQYGYQSRSRARDAVLRGCVKIGGSPIRKPGQLVVPTTQIAIEDDAGDYVSRAALKLAAALDCHSIPVSGKTALDLGASTGGFCQVLLERGANTIFAVDVGSGQLHKSLADDPRLVNLENLNARYLKAGHLDGITPDIVTSDLSFISLKLALPASLEIAANGAWGVFLVKPQFEVGREGIGSGGIVRDEALVKETIDDLMVWLNAQPGWRVIETLPSPIAGGDGNREFLMIARKGTPDE